MKIRNHRKKEWWFYPHENSTLKKHLYVFKYKQDLMKFLTGNLENAISGTVRIEERTFSSSYTLRQYFVWYNEKQYRSGSDLKADLRQMKFRGRNYISKPHKISKEYKRYIAFSDKVISLMCHIEDENGNILRKDAKRLYDLFIKRGFKDFEPTEEDWIYINGHISDGICFSHWSDRCNFLRSKTIIEYFKRSGLLNNC
jgi:hypothetical protein